MAGKPWRKFSDDQIRAIRSSKLSQADLAEKYDVNRTSISDILRRRSYKDISDSKLEINEAAVLSRLAQESGNSGASDIDVAVILDAVVSIFDVTKDELLSSLRDKELADSRQLAMYLTRRHTHLSLSAIGDEFNKKDSTVVHAIRKIEAALDDVQVSQDLSILEGVLGLDPIAAADEQRFAELVNELRTSKGLEPLKYDSQLANQAKLWTAQMARERRVLSFGNGVTVGASSPGSIDILFKAFVARSKDYDNFVDSTTTHHGVAIIHDASAMLWITYHSTEAKSEASASRRERSIPTLTTFEQPSGDEALDKAIKETAERLNKRMLLGAT